MRDCATCAHLYECRCGQSCSFYYPILEPEDLDDDACSQDDYFSYREDWWKYIDEFNDNSELT